MRRYVADISVYLNMPLKDGSIGGGTEEPLSETMCKCVPYCGRVHTLLGRALLSLLAAILKKYVKKFNASINTEAPT